MKRLTLALTAAALATLPNAAIAQQVGTTGSDTGPSLTRGQSELLNFLDESNLSKRLAGWVLDIPAPDRDRFYFLLQQRDSEATMDFLEAKAEEGEVWAMKQIGLIYARGDIVEYDVVRSLNWFATAAERGDGDSALILGAVYTRGDLIRPDAEKAEYWLTRANAFGDYRTKRDVERLRAKG